MTRSKSKKYNNTKPTTTRDQAKNVLAMTTLTAAIGFALSANAQTTMKATTESVKGRAPVVTIQGVVNETATGRAPAPGDVVRVDATSTDPDADPIVGTDYRWTIDAAEVGTSQTYTVQETDAGDTLKVEVTARTNPADTDPSSGTAETTVVVAGAGGVPVARNVEITGTAKVGFTLTGVYRFDDVEDDAEQGTTFRWLRGAEADGSDAEAIENATAETYALTAEDGGMYVFFEVTPRSANWPKVGQAVMVGVATVVEPSAAPLAKDLAILGLVKVGQMLEGKYTYDDLENNPEEGTTFQWYRATDSAGDDKEPIDGATEATYTLTANEEGFFVFFEVTPRSSVPAKVGQAVNVGTVVLAAPLEGSAPEILTVRVEGNYMIGEPLRAIYDQRDPDGDRPAPKFQWYRDLQWTVEPIDGATSEIYVPTQSDLSEYVFVEVTAGSKTGTPKVGNTKTYQRKHPSDGSNFYIPRIAGVGQPAHPWQLPLNLRISGTAEVDGVLTATYDYYSAGNHPENPDAIFKWFRADDPAGTNREEIGEGKTYTVQPSDAGHFILFSARLSPQLEFMTSTPKVPLPEE